jgi:hypothetical protein
MNLLRVTVIVLLSGVADGVEIHSPSTFDSDSEGWQPWSAATAGGQTNSGGSRPVTEIMSSRRTGSDIGPREGSDF